MPLLSQRIQLARILMGVEHGLRALRKHVDAPRRDLISVSVYPENTQESLDACRKVDQLQVAFLKMPQVECPLVHRFTPGLYSRQIFVPASTLTVTKVHGTEHQFVISQGDISIWVDGVGVKRFSAPYHGITKAGTRRLIMHHTDVILTTFHPTDETDPDVIEDQIIIKHEPAALTEAGDLALKGAVAQLLAGNQPCLS